MDYNNHNTTLRTNKHLNFEERFYLEKRIVLGDSITAISSTLGRSRTTIYTELKRGVNDTLRMYKNDDIRMYKNDDIRMYNFDCITDTIVEVITTCNTYTLLTVHLL